MIIIITIVIRIIYEIIDIMQIIRGDSYQSWVYANKEDLIAVDPWLTRKQVFPGLSWLLFRDSQEPSYLEKQNQIHSVTHLIITAHFSDHLDLESLDKFNLDIPIYTTREASKLLRKHGFHNVIAVETNKKFQLGSFELEVFMAGKPYNTTTFSYTLRVLESGVFHEPHMFNQQLQIKDINACILTVDQVKVLGFVQVSMGIKQALKAQKSLNSKYLLATGIAPNKSKGLITWLLSTQENYGSSSNGPIACQKTGDSLVL